MQVRSAPFCPRSKITSELSIFSSLVSIGAVGIHGHPLPEVSQPVWPQRASSAPEPPACGGSRRPCQWHRCQSVRRDRWSGVLRINRGTAHSAALSYLSECQGGNTVPLDLYGATRSGPAYPVAAYFRPRAFHESDVDLAPGAAAGLLARAGRRSRGRLRTATKWETRGRSLV